MKLTGTKWNRALLALTCWAVAAYLPMVSWYTPSMDDWPLSRTLDHGWRAYFSVAWQERGIWRVLQHATTALLVNTGQWIFPLVAILTHLVVVVLVWTKLCSYVREGIAFGAALIIAVFPSGFQAVAWTCAWPYAFGVASFLVCWTILTVPPKRFVFASVTVAVLLTWMSLLLHDNFVFAWLAFGPCLAIMEMDKFSRVLSMRQWFRQLLRWTPTLCAVVYLAMYTMSSPSTHDRYLSPRWNWESVLSGTYYQWSHLQALELAGLSSPVEILKSMLDSSVLVAAIIAGFSAFLTVRWQSANSSGDGVGKPSVMVILGLLLMFWSCLFIYVPAGGIALDSRKKYPMLVLLVLVVAVALERVFPKACPRWLVGFGMAGGGITLCFLTWLHLATWFGQARAVERLIAWWPQHGQPGRFQLETDPPLMLEWVGARRYWGGDFFSPGALDLAASARGASLPEVVDRGASADGVLLYNYELGTWSMKKLNR